MKPVDFANKAVKKLRKTLNCLPPPEGSFPFVLNYSSGEGRNITQTYSQDKNLKGRIKQGENGELLVIDRTRHPNDGSAVLQRNGFIREGYDFAGWQICSRDEQKWLCADNRFHLAKKVRFSILLYPGLFPEGAKVPACAVVKGAKLFATALWIPHDCQQRLAAMAERYASGAEDRKRLLTRMDLFVSFLHAPVTQAQMQQVYQLLEGLCEPLDGEARYAALYAYLEAAGRIMGRFGCNAQEQLVLLEKLNGVLALFGAPLSPRHIERILQFEVDLHRHHKVTYSQVLSSLDFLQFLFTTQKSPKNAARAGALICSILSADGEKEPTKGEITTLGLKYLLSAVYDLNLHQTVGHKLLFMQPRRGLNETFRYLYHKLEDETDWELALYEMHRDTVPTEVYYANAAYFIRDMTAAHTVFVHESNNLLGYIHIRPETKVVQLWHGCGVFKHIGLSTVGKKGFKSAAKYAEFPEYNKYSVVTIASSELNWVFEEFMGIPKESETIQALGVARTDEFYSDGYVDRCFEKLYKAIPAAKGRKTILYAPTYRGLDPNRVSPDALNIPKFAQMLGDDYILIMKHHQTVKQVPEIPEPYRNTFAYDMTRGKGMNINELMTVADICITDYSSVAFEFSVFERPLLFFVYDLEEYIDDRGLYYNFDEITPGPLCRTTEEMADYIRSLENGFDATEVSDFKQRFMRSCDGHACERTIAFLTENTIVYDGNGAQQERVHVKTAHPIPAQYQLIANPFQREGYRFLGWSMYQYEGMTVYYLCKDGKWHMDDEVDAHKAEIRVFREQERFTDLRPKNGNALFFGAQWEQV